MIRLRRLQLVALIVVALPAPLFSVEAPVPLREARFVVIGLDLDDRILTGADVHVHPGVTPADRRALEDVRAAIEKWGRYVVVDSPRQADLILAVRKARFVAAHASVSFPLGGRDTGATRHGLGLAASSPHDEITVFEVLSETRGPMWWTRQRRDGLRGPSPALVEDLRDLVEGRPRRP